MKSSLIFTFSRSYNYGASLQAYSLQRAIRSLGSDCKIIDTRSVEEANGHIEYRTDFRGRFLNFFTYINRKKLLKGRQCFNDFNYSSEDRVKLPAINGYPQKEALERMGQLADVYISGSDQVFSPAMMSELYFLQFNTWAAECISYAASMGVSEVPESKKSIMKRYLKKFDSISVREPSAKTALQPLTDKSIQVHIDPTLLTERDDWVKAEKEYTPLVQTKYILAYFLYRPSDMNQQLRKLHRETGLPVVLIDTSAFRNIYHQKIVLDAGPQEFLWLIHHAELVVTSSFHGSAMSIIYEKPFVVFNNPSTPARIENLLSLTKLEKQWIKHGTELTEECFKIPEASFEFAKKEISKEKERSLSYLRGCLSD